MNRIVAVGANITPENENHVRIEMVSLQNEDVSPNYQVQISEDDGVHYQTAAEWTRDSTLDIVVPTEPDCKIKVLAKTEGSGTVDAYQVYNYFR